jgi:peptidyl-prolyl cis-trans isomerase SurA
MRTLLALLLSLLVATVATAQEIVDGIAAQVGSEIVLISDIYQIAEPTEKRLRVAGASEEEIAQLHLEILERMIERALIRQVVQRTELDATEAEIDDTIRGIAAENGLSVEQLKESVEAQGLPFERYRERIRGEIEQAKVINGMIGSQVRLEEEDVRALYDQEYGDQPEGGMEVHLRHILVPFEGEDPAARRRARSRVSEALARIRAGERFEDLAAEVSAVNPEKGGDIGWFHASSLAPWMTSAIESLPAGGTSEVIEMPFGCNLLHIVDKRLYEEITYEGARKHLADYLYQQRLGEEYASFIEKLRQETFIERKGVFAGAARLGDENETGADSIDLGLGNDKF